MWDGEPEHLRQASQYNSEVRENRDNEQREQQQNDEQQQQRETQGQRKRHRWTPPPRDGEVEGPETPRPVSGRSTPVSPLSPDDQETRLRSITPSQLLQNEPSPGEESQHAGDLTPLLHIPRMPLSPLSPDEQHGGDSTQTGEQIMQSQETNEGSQSNLSESLTPLSQSEATQTLSGEGNIQEHIGITPEPNEERDEAEGTWILDPFLGTLYEIQRNPDWARFEDVLIEIE
ncbi:putative uncharacterized protein DDB_G0294196, partial [Homarus americanus]|uniref:putative uncharacterized protein DDB_G0294196 n=1 Tax=Homarus americanus TaxID=6706 RepID=UPI001C449367